MFQLAWGVMVCYAGTLGAMLVLALPTRPYVTDVRTVRVFVLLHQVHIFPEGTRSRQPTQLGPIRKGVGRLVAAAAAAAPEGTPAPLVVPFVHAGMEDIMPVGSKLPSVGQKVSTLCKFATSVYSQWLGSGTRPCWF